MVRVFVYPLGLQYKSPIIQNDVVEAGILLGPRKTVFRLIIVHPRPTAG